MRKSYSIAPHPAFTDKFVSDEEFTVLEAIERFQAMRAVDSPAIAQFYLKNVSLKALGSADEMKS